MTFRIVLCVLGFALSHSAIARGDLRIDLRIQTPARPERIHTLELCARPTDQRGQGPGHAFVVFRGDGDGRQSEFLAVGFGPEAEKNTALPVTGVLKPENFTHAEQRCLIAEVSRSVYNEARSFVEAQREISIGDIKVPVRSKYIVVLSDCVKFQSGVAKFLKLKLPSRATNLTPMQFIAALIEANK